MTTPAILAEVPHGHLSPGWDFWNRTHVARPRYCFKRKLGPGLQTSGGLPWVGAILQIVRFFLSIAGGARWDIVR